MKSMKNRKNEQLNKQYSSKLDIVQAVEEKPIEKRYLKDIYAQTEHFFLFIRIVHIKKFVIWLIS